MQLQNGKEKEKENLKSAGLCSETDPGEMTYVKHENNHSNKIVSMKKQVWLLKSI